MVALRDADVENSPDSIRDQEDGVAPPSSTNDPTQSSGSQASDKPLSFDERMQLDRDRRDRLQQKLADRENDHNLQKMDLENEGDFKQRGLRLGKGLFLFVNKHKKKTVAGLVLGGGGVGIAVASFFAVQPFKVVSIVEQLEGFYGGPTTSIVTRMSDKFVVRYMQRYVMPGLLGVKPRCVTTAKPGCVANVTGKGPVARAMHAMWQGHWEVDLASQENGMFFVRQGSTIKMLVKPEGSSTFVQGFSADQDSEFIKAIVGGKADLFDPALSPLGIGKGGAFDRKTIREGLKLIDSAYSKGWFNNIKRFFVKRVFIHKYAGLSCFFNCTIANPLQAPAAKLKFAFKDWLAKSLQERYGGTIMGDALSCLLKSGDCDSIQKVQPSTAQAGEVAPAASATGEVSSIEAEVVSEVAGEVLKEGGAKVLEDEIATRSAGEILGKAAAEGERGFLSTIVASILKSLFPEIATDVALNALPVAGTVIMIVLIVGAIVAFADSGNPGLMHATYIGNAIMAVQLFGVYRTVTAEVQTGKIDMNGLNSFNDGLTTNATGSAKDQVDATTTPLYGAMFGGAPTNTSYRCNDGSQVPDGKLVCPEEKLAQGNAILDGAHNVVNFVPGLAALGHIVNAINDFIGFIAGKGIELACHAVDIVPPGNACSNVVKAATPLFGQLVAWLMDKLVVSPFAGNMSGGRTFDMMAAGADVLYNKSCQLQLGCAQITDQQATALRNDALDMQKQEFASRPIFARMFSTDTPYSLVSQLALALPSSPSQATTQLAGMFTNPLNNVGSMVSRLLSGSKVFAASTFPDPFGVVQYGYTEDQIPDDPETYWDQHCQGRDFATEWDNSQPINETTGEPVATTPEPCMLLQATAGAVGGRYDTSLLPADALNQDPKQQ